MLVALSILVSPFAVLADDAGFALRFDGENDAVVVGDTGDTLGDGWASTKTVSLWLKPDAPAQGPTSGYVGEYIVGTDRPRIFGINRSNLGDGDKLRVWNSDGGPDTVAVDFTPGEWVHIAMVHAGGTLTVYKDGEVAGVVASGETYAPADGTLWIGGGNRTDPANFFGGEIDEVQFWGAALDRATIQAWMYRELDTGHPNWADLRVYYSMSDGAGTTLSDDSGNGVTGSFRGGMSDDNWVTSGAFDGAPSTTPPVADPQVLSTPEDVALPVSLTGTDLDEDPLTFSVVSGPSNGVLSGTAPNLTYTPNANYHGVDAFTFVANDGFVNSAPATVEITVAAVNDDPVATDDDVTVEQDTAGVFDVLSNDVDVDGDTLTITGVGAAENGVAVNNGADVSYTPNAGYVGLDSFTYTVDDGNGGAVTATVNVDVQRVNNAPVADPQVLGTPEDMALGVVLTGFDADGDPLTYSVVSGPSNGVLSGTAPDLTYTPNANYHGVDAFTFVANDGFVNSAQATVEITVTAVNDDPVATDDDVMVEQDTVGVFDVLSNDADVDGDTLTITGVGAATNGDVGYSGVDVSYTPNDGYVGLDSFTYTVDDGNGGAATATVNVDVRAVSQAGYALSFDGASDYVIVAETANILGSGWESSKSVTLWVKPTGLPADPQHPTPAFCDAVIGDRPRWWGISRCEIDGNDRLWIWNYDGGFDGIGVEYAPDEWIQVGFVHEGGVLTAYKNGVAVGSVESGATLQPNTGALPILHYGGVIINASRNWTFQGEIDEVRVWYGARSPADIVADLLQPLNGDEPGLSAYYQMSDEQGSTVTDDSQYSWDGTLVDGKPPQVPEDGPIEWVSSGAFQLQASAASELAGETIVLQLEDVSLVDLADFTVERRGEAAFISWYTYSEYFNQGFNLYRAASVDGPYERITEDLVVSTGGDSEAHYEFTDRPGAGTFYYMLEDVNDEGVANQHAPVAVTVGDVKDTTGPSIFLPSLRR